MLISLLEFFLFVEGLMFTVFDPLKPLSLSGLFTEPVRKEVPVYTTGGLTSTRKSLLYLLFTLDLLSWFMGDS